MLADISTMSLLHAGCAAIYGALIGLILLRARLSRTGLMLAAACGVTMAWAIAVALRPGWRVSGSGGLARACPLGIGVFQARELLRECGGDLRAISQPDMGRTMRLLLPSLVGAAEDNVTHATVRAA